MFYNHITLIAALTFHGVIDVNTSFRIVPLFKENPGIRIQISGIIGLSLYGLIAHFFRFIQITTLY